jgi:hypothetical protein
LPRCLPGIPASSAWGERGDHAGDARTAARIRTDTEAGKHVRALRSMQLTGAVLPTGHARGDAVTFINKGDELPESHPAVRARPKDFEPVR